MMVLDFSVDRVSLSSARDDVHTTRQEDRRNAEARNGICRLLLLPPYVAVYAVKHCE